MGFFEKLFGKKKEYSNSLKEDYEKTIRLQAGTEIVSTGDNVAYPFTKNLTEEQKVGIENSTILLRSGQVYMHYWTDN